MKEIGSSYVMKWFVTIIISGLLVYSTIYRSLEGKDADKTVCAVFTIALGFVWGTNLINYFIKK